MSKERKQCISRKIFKLVTLRTNEGIVVLYQKLLKQCFCDDASNDFLEVFKRIAITLIFLKVE